MKLKYFITSIFTAGLALFAWHMASAATTATIAVTATVVKSCSITATPLAFGTYDPLSATADNAVATITVACTKGTPGTPTLFVGMDQGTGQGTGTCSYAGGTTKRAMKDSASNKLCYEVYQPSNNTPGTACTYAVGTDTVWTNTAPPAGGFGLTSPTSSAGRTYNVCGVIPAGQDVSVASFSDTLTATVNF